jgi:hypothetical protein
MDGRVRVSGSHHILAKPGHAPVTVPALFVEGDDHKLLREIARAVGAVNLANELGVALIPIGGFSQWDRIEPFKWRAIFWCPVQLRASQERLKTG